MTCLDAAWEYARRGLQVIPVQGIRAGKCTCQDWRDNNGKGACGTPGKQARLAARLAAKTGREVLVGPYSESNGSLHIYGQDYSTKGMDKFFTRFPDCEPFVRRARTSGFVRDAEVIPQLQDLLKESTWRFRPEAVRLIEDMIEDYRSARFVP